VRSIQFVLILLLLPAFTFAQAQIVTGKVSNMQGGEALIGASVIEVGGSNGTVTDAEGNFSLEVLQEQSTLEISYLGYKKLRVTCDGRSFYNINLQEDNFSLNEVVVTALNLERSSKDLGYAIQELNAKELNEVKSVNFTDNLGARVAGLTVNQGATGVGSSTKITIRGESSFSNNNPLFVVDGLPIQNNTDLNFTSEAAAGFQEVDFGNGAMDINSDDIESVSVLKGPGAAALYGTRAANGVILINTKKGVDSKEFKVDVNTSVFIDKPFKLPEFQNRYGQGNSGEFGFVDGLGAGVNDNITYSWGPELDAGVSVPQFDSQVTLANGDVVRGGDVAVHGGATIPSSPFVSYPDNLKNFYDTGVTAITNLAFSRGFENGSLEISANMNYAFSNSDNRPSSGYGSENINYSLVAWGPRSLDTEILRDYWQPGLEDEQQYSFNYTFFDNPFFILGENTNAFRRNRFYGNVLAKYQISDALSFHASAGNDTKCLRRTRCPF